MYTVGLKLSSLAIALVALLIAACSSTAEPEPAATATSIQSPTSISAPMTTATGVPASALDPTSTPPSIATTIPGFEIITLPIPTIMFSRSDIPPYDRDEWNHWIDTDGDCQNTRHEVLIAESLADVTFTNSQNCTVANGEWLASFTGTTVTVGRDLDVDHLVPLANAHRSGGHAWDADRKKAFANNLEYADHLIAVTASANRAKGAKGPEEWKPPDEGYWCDYAIAWATVKTTWELEMTPDEFSAVQEMLGTCTDQLVLFSEPAGTSAPMLPPTSSYVALRFDPNGPDRNCGDFDTWDEANAFFLAAGGPDEDRHRLDSDRDGTPCTSLPGAP